MKKQNLEHTDAEERVSPLGHFHLWQKNLSLALGGIKDKGLGQGGHPFDVCEVRIPAGKSNWPLHAHSAQWEFYLIKSGRGKVIKSDGETEVGSGDYFVCPPGEAHQVSNSFEEELVMLVIADNPGSDMIRYPNTENFFLKPSRSMFSVLGEKREPYEGEE